MWFGGWWHCLRNQHPSCPPHTHTHTHTQIKSRGLLHKADFRFYPGKFVFSLSKPCFRAQEGVLVLSGFLQHGTRLWATLILFWVRDRIPKLDQSAVSKVTYLMYIPPPPPPLHTYRSLQIKAVYSRRISEMKLPDFCGYLIYLYYINYNCL